MPRQNLLPWRSSRALLLQSLLLRRSVIIRTGQVVPALRAQQLAPPRFQAPRAHRAIHRRIARSFGTALRHRNLLRAPRHFTLHGAVLSHKPVPACKENFFPLGVWQGILSRGRSSRKEREEVEDRRGARQPSFIWCCSVLGFTGPGGICGHSIGPGSRHNQAPMNFPRQSPPLPQLHAPARAARPVRAPRK